MKDITKDALKSAVPNWIVAVLMGVCVFYLKRSVEQIDSVANEVRTHSTAIVVLDKSQDKLTTAIGNIDQICRNLEMRLVRMETREKSNDRPN